MALRASEIPTARYLDEEGEHVLVVRDYFRRDTARGVPALHARMEVVRTVDPLGRWSAHCAGAKVTRPFPLAGPGVSFLGDLLRATGNEDIALEPDDDAAIARAICLQPFRAYCRWSRPVPSKKRPGETVRFMNVVQIRRLERLQEVEAWLPDYLSGVMDWASLCVPDPRSRS